MPGPSCKEKVQEDLWLAAPTCLSWNYLEGKEHGCPQRCGAFRRSSVLDKNLNQLEAPDVVFFFLIFLAFFWCFIGLGIVFLFSSSFFRLDICLGFVPFSLNNLCCFPI